MGIPLMIQDDDNRRIENLKKDFGIHKKIDVIRAGLELLEKESAQLKKIKRWQRAAKLVAKTSDEVNQDFQKHSKVRWNEK